MRRGLINRARVRYSWGRGKLAVAMMEKCARQHIPEVVPLSSWSLKMNKALAARARNAPKNLKKFEQSYRKEVSVNGREVKSFAWHALFLSQLFLSLSLILQGLITLIVSAIDPIAGTRMEEVLENFIQKRRTGNRIRHRRGRRDRKYRRRKACSRKKKTKKWGIKQIKRTKKEETYRITMS